MGDISTVLQFITVAVVMIVAPYSTPWAIAIMIGGTVLAGALIEEPEELASLEDSLAGGIGARSNTRSPNEPLKVLYGEFRLGGNDVYINTSGTDNTDLWLVQTLSEGECQGIVQDDEAVDQVFLGDEIYTTRGGNVEYWFHKGTATQVVDPNLNAAFPMEWTDPMHYVAYIVWKLTYDQDYFQGVPKRTVVLQGLKLYDFRDSTTAYSNNPVLCLYDYLTNTRYGMGISSGKVDIASWTQAANYCDTKGWHFNMLISRDQAAFDILKAMLGTFRGQFVWWNGQYYIRYADLNYEASVMEVTDEHTVRDAGGKSSITINQPSKFDVPDGLKVTFIDAAKDWISDTIPVGDETGVIRELKLPGVTDREHASNLGIYTLERMKLNRGISGTFRDELLKLEQNDVINFTSSAMSINDQLMRVGSPVIRPDGLIEMALNYESLALYDDDYNLDVEGVYTCTLPDPLTEPPSVRNVSITEEQYFYRLQTYTRLKITFDKPLTYPWFSYAEVWLSYDNIAWEHQFNSTGDFEIDTVEEGVKYYIRLTVVSIWRTKQSVGSSYVSSHQVEGKVDIPSSLTELVASVNQNDINLYADKVADPDVELYEFRLGTTWSTAVFLAANRDPMFSLFGVKLGTHTFLANTLSNNGRYGLTPAAATVTIDGDAADPLAPDGWAVTNTETCDYDGIGTHDNTEHVLDNGDHYVKCSHGGGVLTGTYLSPIYDRGAVGRYLIYVAADMLMTGEGSDWNSIVPIPNTWNYLDVSRRWFDIFELEAGPGIEFSLLYGDASPPLTEVKKMGILSTIATGRYFQIKIVITDPSDAVNAMIEEFTLRFCQ